MFVRDSADVRWTCTFLQLYIQPHAERDNGLWSSRITSAYKRLRLVFNRVFVVFLLCRCMSRKSSYSKHMLSLDTDIYIL